MHTSFTNRRARRRARLLAALGGFLAVAAPLEAQAPARTAATTGGGLYVPRAVRQAYRNGTRSSDGRPGPRYWQNRARYTIDVTVAPPNRAVRGTERIAYVNASPDTLRTLVFKVFMNIHKPGAPRNGGANPDYLTSGVHVDRFAVNGAPVKWDSSGRYFTWEPVTLPSPLLPHDSVQVDVDWHFDLSRESGREGMIDSTTAFLAYFYPRVAVYDDYEGWDRMTFTDQQEFYSDFNDYDVTVRAPANWVVWGTGTLRNPDAVLQPAPLGRYRASLASEQVVNVATLAQLRAKAITLQQPVNAWHFTAANVPDVTFAASDHYDWDAASVVVDSATGRRASVQAAYNDTAPDFHQMVRYGQHALSWLSRNWPGVPYPYEKTTIVQGFAGMEYPMMVNDEPYADTTFSRFVAEHEIAHTWFPFYMGINETRYGFMDEGWATTFEHLIAIADMGQPKADEFFRQFRVNGWIHDPSPTEDLPIVTPEDVLDASAYGNNAYGKPSLGYLALKDMLGDDLFRRSLHAFMDRWHGKHPIPWDFFATVNDVSGRNLDWFWRSWYFENSYIDVAVRGVTRGAGGAWSVQLENVGGMPAPVDLVIGYADGTSATVHETSAIWAREVRRATVGLAGRKAVRSVALGHGIWVDADSTNDRWRGGR